MDVQRIRKAYQWRKIAKTEQEIIWNIRRSYFGAMNGSNI